MAKAEASVEELVGMIERGELRLPEMQRRYVALDSRRDLLDSLYRATLLCHSTLGNDETVPLQEMAVTQQLNIPKARVSCLTSAAANLPIRGHPR